MERAELGEWASTEHGSENEEDEFSDVDDKEGFPHACFICRDGFTDPVVTLCGLVCYVLGMYVQYSRCKYILYDFQLLFYSVIFFQTNVISICQALLLCELRK